jgi:peptidoglycan/LPS O-acetylase OafA/YrhL
MPKVSQHIPSLDGLRAFSFMLVCFAHAGLEHLVPGGLGVTIFFFLSGFLITTLMRSEYERNAAINLPHFWLRRALRILPPFYLVLIGATLTTLAFESAEKLSPAAIAALALHYGNYWIIGRGYDGLPAGTGVYWSLAVEEHFYLLFPWVYIAFQRLKLSARTQALSFWGLCLFVLLWRCALVFVFNVPENRTYMASDTRIDSILFGCALAVWNNPVLDRVQLCEVKWKYFYVPVAALGIVACVLVRGAAFRETLRYSLQGAALTPIFIAAIRFDKWTPFRLLNVRVMVFIGALSYSLYLMHFTVLYAVQRAFTTLHPVLQTATAFVGSLGLAWLMQICVEKPCARLRKQLSD